MSDLPGLDRDALDRARLSRDPRFDGRFFIAVTSTGIYCRPICPSPTSNAANVRYYGSAAAAAEAGFRPCLRCRPEAAPGSPAWQGTSAVVSRALRLIQEGLLDEASVDVLAQRLGIGPRHLHRLFVRHVGASPTTVAGTRRLQFAKNLLDETEMPITQIALAAGFGSVRRFNDAFRRTYGRSPREMRRQRRGGLTPQASDEVVLRLAYRPPYDWGHLRDFLAERAVPGVERVDARGYSRTLTSDRGHAIMRVRPLDGQHSLELRVCGAAPAELFPICVAARRCFDLSADPARIAAALASDPLLAPLVRQRPGLRIPGAWDPFECAVEAMLARGTSTAEAREAAGRLVARAGRAIRGGTDGLTHVFPSPAELAAADLDGVGIGRSRLAGLEALARAVGRGSVDFKGPAAEISGALASLPGFDESAAQYVALRGLGEPDAFPSASGELRSQAEAWRPWRGYATLWLSQPEPVSVP
jgi:AraC family transcriptional regulator of adaptative response / DNA-3-methyladenine glycosylase II